MVLVMRVCREWLEIIDENRSLWKELILPQEKKVSGLKVLELFDRKSQSMLTRVSMNVAAVRENTTFIGILKKSKETLQVLNFTEGYDGRFQDKMTDEVWGYPRLEFCNLYTVASPLVQLILSGRGKELAAHDHQGSPLRVLWVFDSKALFSSDSHLLRNLVSLSLYASHDSLRWRRVLEGPSQSLKHLRFTLKDCKDPSISALEFPNLKVLDLGASDPSRSFPTWVKFPSSATLIIRRSSFLSSLPSCSRLWIAPLTNILKLQARCPALSELRLNSTYPESFNSVNSAKLISMLSQRKSNVEAGMEIDGIKMLQLKTLVLPFRLAKDELLSLLRELVEEVVDLESVSSFIELEI